MRFYYIYDNFNSSIYTMMPTYKPFSQKTISIFCFILLISTSIQAQEKKSDFWNHVRFGGGIGLSFGNEFFSGTLAPSALYDINPYVSVGLGLNGTYSSRKYYHKSTIFGGSVIGIFNPIPQLQISTEFEQLNVNRDWDSRWGIADENYWYPALFLGAGFRAQNVTVGMRFDVLYDSDKSIYAQSWMPFVRVYF
ncbi:alpha-ketoglutarate decarboxylase [Mangrovimonas sp. ST2L15]|uniref:alpha-ketoglutarate decarboxylase n=1 Tax=Mangrovimonas sp. ST2L15 TaxID=1645916 RepID=UPI000AA302D7|nr:alpha-ketoglutarate decarboxylase [Mangrovimonas sp. ST2L15]